jgi:hypothetical protein
MLAGLGQTAAVRRQAEGLFEPASACSPAPRLASAWPSFMRTVSARGSSLAASCSCSTDSCSRPVCISAWP